MSDNPFQTRVALPKKGSPMSTEKYSDQQVVAAFNSCFDLEKYKALPPRVKSRFKTLLLHHRIKPVCFFEEEGFGLRVYHEIAGNFEFQEDGDEVKPTDALGAWEVDVDGSWMRCPAKLWEEKKEEVKEWVVAIDSTARRYIGFNMNEETENWHPLTRASAKKFTRTEADRLVKNFPEGLVIKQGV